MTIPFLRLDHKLRPLVPLGWLGAIDIDKSLLAASLLNYRDEGEDNGLPPVMMEIGAYKKERPIRDPSRQWKKNW